MSQPHYKNTKCIPISNLPIRFYPCTFFFFFNLTPLFFQFVKNNTPQMVLELKTTNRGVPRLNYTAPPVLACWLVPLVVILSGCENMYNCVYGTSNPVCSGDMEISCLCSCLSSEMDWKSTEILFNRDLIIYL